MTEAGWTSQRPNREGVYWFRWSVSSRPLIVSVAKDDCAWRVLEMGNQYDGSLAGYSDGEWLGPITPTDRQRGKVEGIQESKNLVSEFIEAWLLAGMVAKLLTPAVHEAVGGLSRDLRRELQKIEQDAQDEKGVGE